MQGEDDDFGRPLGFEEAPAHFTSATQKARFQTEDWASRWLFCPSCGASSLGRFPNNRAVADFYCRECPEQYELKSTQKPFGPKVPDGAFDKMCQRLAAQDNPNLFLLRYERAEEGMPKAAELLVIPKQFFVRDIIEERTPLAATARRAGWKGCNILVGRVPEIGKIILLKDRVETPRAVVRRQWERTLFLRRAAPDARGWLIEVMAAVEAIGRPTFTLDEVYASEARLQALYPGNHNVRPKIRQQLQELRKLGYVDFTGRGTYRLLSS